jgi:3-oxoadipate enol-lactonase
VAAPAGGAGRQYRVIAPDLRGHGASDAPPGPYLMDDFAADLQALLDHLGLARVIYCGLSMGGYIGFAFVRRYPATGRADAGRYPRGR